jgi:hypothetical protein
MTWFIRYIFCQNLQFLNHAIIIKTKVLLHQVRWTKSILSILFKSFGFLAPKNFQIFWLWAYLMKVILLSVPDEGYSVERTWWRLFRWAYLMKVIPLSVPDEGYSVERTWWRLFRWAYLMKVIPLSIPDEGYSRNVSCTLSLISMVYYLSMELNKGFSITCNLQVILNDYLKSKR